MSTIIFRGITLLCSSYKSNFRRKKGKLVYFLVSNDFTVIQLDLEGHKVAGI